MSIAALDGDNGILRGLVRVGDDPSTVIRLDLPAPTQKTAFHDLGGLSPMDLELSDDGTRLYVASLEPLGLSVLDAATGQRLDIVGPPGARPSTLRIARGCGSGQILRFAP